MMFRMVFTISAVRVWRVGSFVGLLGLAGAVVLGSFFRLVLVKDSFRGLGIEFEFISYGDLG